jgi:2-dehydro-3-deoxy-D-arabinonate dehydratase
MHLVRFTRKPGTVEVAVITESGMALLPDAPSASSLLRLSSAQLRVTLDAAALHGERIDPEGIRLLAPVDGRTEVWAAGVTFERSRVARVEESGQASVYDTVYDADRPELFFKAPAWRVVTDGEPAGIRADAENSVPEPEVALLINSAAEIVGATICDDLTARSIEGGNPLYLPQAKMYAGSCVLGARVRPWWEIADPYALDVTMRITRGDNEVFTGSSSTARLHRRFDELVSWLFRQEQFPDGVVLSTGTGIVPPLDLGLRPGDVIDIRISELGAISHPVRNDTAAFGWLAR